MNRYELVVLIDPRLSGDDIKAKKEEVEKMIKSGNGEIEDIDDIGYLDLHFAINKERKAYFYSICLKIENEGLASIKKQLKVFAGVNRWKIFKMSDKEKFLKYSEVNKQIAVEATKEEGIFNEIDRS